MVDYSSGLESPNSSATSTESRLIDAIWASDKHADSICRGLYAPKAELIPILFARYSLEIERPSPFTLLCADGAFLINTSIR